MNGSFNPGGAAGRAFRFTMTEGFADRMRLDCESGAGFHSSRSDASPHFTFRNGEGQVTGHAYGNGAFKSVGGAPGPIGLF